ncbi:ribonuclease H-like domain-containing protein [Tanacetum coccineum]
MLNCNPCTTPIDTEKKLGPEGSSVTDPTLYRSLVGSLLYLTFTRPDLSYVVQQLCLYMHDSREPHLNAMKRVLRYLRGTTNLGLQLFRSTTSQLIAYFDADWAGCPATCQSTSGYCVFLGDNLLTCATHSSIGRSPFSVVYQKSPRCVVDLVKQPKVHEYSSAPARLANDSQGIQEEVLTAIGNFRICSIVVGMMIQVRDYIYVVDLDGHRFCIKETLRLHSCCGFRWTQILH